MKIVPGFIIKILLLAASFGASTVFSQDTLKGRILDVTTLQPLEHVNVINTATGKGTISDHGGYFRMVHAPEISVTTLGYETQSIQVDPEVTFIRVLLEASAFELEEVVVSAIPADQAKLQRSSAALSILDKRELEADNGSIIAPALNRSTGVYMHSGALNTNRITIRGIGARTPYSTNKVRAYLKDIPLTTGTGETTIEDVDLDLIERVEVIKGPSSSLYGAGLGGALILYPRKPAGNKLRVVQKNTFGSFGLFRNTTGVSSSGKKGSLNLSYNKTHSDGYRENNTYDRSGLFLLGEYFPSEKHSFTLMALYTSVKAYIPSSIDSLDYTTNPQAAAAAWLENQGFEDYDKFLAGLAHQVDIRRNMSLKTAMFSGFKNNYELRPFNVLKEESANFGLRSYLSYHPVLGKVKANLLAGGELFTENYVWSTYENVDREPGPLLSDNREVRQYANLFFQSAFYLTDKITLSAGINLNKTTYDYQDRYLSNGDQTGDHGFDPVVSPRIAVSYAQAPGLFLYANASHGFSPPGLEETLTPEGAVNPDIRPESGWNFEVGLRGKVYRGKLFYDASIYSMQIKDLLVFRRIDEDQYVGLNAGETNHNGIEVLLKYLFVQTEGLTAMAFANGSFTEYRFEEFIDGDADYSGNRLPGAPENAVNAGVNMHSGIGIYGNVNYQFVDRMPLRDDNSIYSTPYQLLNMKVGYSRTFFNRLEIEVFGGISNVLSEKYASMHLVNAVSFGGNSPRYYYPGLPVNYFAGFTIAFDVR